MSSYINHSTRAAHSIEYSQQNSFSGNRCNLEVRVIRTIRLKCLLWLCKHVNVFKPVTGNCEHNTGLKKPGWAHRCEFTTDEGKICHFCIINRYRWHIDIGYINTEWATYLRTVLMAILTEFRGFQEEWSVCLDYWFTAE